MSTASIFNDADYQALHRYVFRLNPDGSPAFSGYKPTVKEIPNGDGKKDEDKIYAHVAPKYFTSPDDAGALLPYLRKAHDVAVEIADALNVPAPFMPRIEYGALRILDYPPGAVSNRHQDLDLFTVMCFRDAPDHFITLDESPDVRTRRALRIARAINPQVHFGDLGAAIGMGNATPHEVVASTKRQRSMVYFAIPDHKVFMPYGGPPVSIPGGTEETPCLIVRDWLNERMARSRTSFKAYE